MIIGDIHFKDIHLSSVYANLVCDGLMMISKNPELFCGSSLLTGKISPLNPLKIASAVVPITIGATIGMLEYCDSAKELCHDIENTSHHVLDKIKSLRSKAFDNPKNNASDISHINNIKIH